MATRQTQGGASALPTLWPARCERPPFPIGRQIRTSRRIFEGDRSRTVTTVYEVGEESCEVLTILFPAGRPRDNREAVTWPTARLWETIWARGAVLLPEGRAEP